MSKSSDTAPKVLELVKKSNEVVVLRGGVRIKISQLPVSLFDAINEKFSNPEPPEVMIEEKGRTEPNPNDPDYINQLEVVARKRGQAFIDAVYILSVEFMDELPDDKTWIPVLQYTAKLVGVPDMSEYDLKDPMDRKLLFLKYYGVGRSAFNSIMNRASITEEGIRDAEAAFPSDEARSADTDSTG